MLEALGEPEVYKELEAKSAKLADGLAEAARGAGVSTVHTRVGSMMCTFFADGPAPIPARICSGIVQVWGGFPWAVPTCPSCLYLPE